MKTLKRISSYLLLISMVFMFSSCNKEDNQYKKFSNEYFSFTYPNDWSVDGKDNNVTLTGPIEDTYFVNIKFDFNPEINVPVDEFRRTVESQNRVELLPGFVDGGVEELKISGLDAIKHSLKTVVKPTENAPNITLFVNLIYVVSDDQKIGVVITSEVPERYSLKYEDIFNKVINSFKFN